MTKNKKDGVPGEYQPCYRRSYPGRYPGMSTTMLYPEDTLHSNQHTTRFAKNTGGLA